MARPDPGEVELRPAGAKKNRSGASFPFTSRVVVCIISRRVSLMDSILNLASLLLWLSWRTSGFALHLGAPLALLGTLKRAEARPPRRWPSLASLLALLLLRALFYWQIGPGINWTPHLQLGVTILFFRSDYFGNALLFSCLSFGRILATFYLWLLLLSIVNRRIGEDDPVQKLVRLHLGWLERAPVFLKLILPSLVITALWLALGGLFTRWHLLPPATISESLRRGLLISLSAFVTCKYLITGFLLLHLLSSYVYLGNSPGWGFVEATARNLLTPLRFIPLRLGKVDFAPGLGIALVLVAGEWGLRWLVRMY
jgi:uncharacterized protein YggT (Ycf19 family)